MEWDGDTNHGASASSIPDVDVAVMGLNDPLRNGEPQARTVRLGREERVEHAGEMIRRKPWPLIGHLDNSVATRRERFDPDLAGGRSRLNPIQDQVEEDLPDLFRVDVRVGQRFARLMHEDDAGPFRFGPQQEQHVLNDVPKAGRPEFGRMRPRVGQELLNEVVQAFQFCRRDSGEFRLRCP